MKLLYTAIAVMLLTRHAFSQQTTSERLTFHMTDRVFTCSSWLSLLIKNFCDNMYKIVKRDTSMMINKMLPKSIQEQRKKERLLAEERWRRVRRQVASECCDRPCTVANVIQYCPDDAKLLKERPDIFD